jgi:hypothetical protein
VLAAGGANVHAGRVHSADGTATCVFELTGRRGQKLSPADEASIRALLHAGVPDGQRRRKRRSADAP